MRRIESPNHHEGQVSRQWNIGIPAATPLEAGEGGLGNLEVVRSERCAPAGGFLDGRIQANPYLFQT